MESSLLWTMRAVRGRSLFIVWGCLLWRCMNSGLWVGATAPALAGPRLLRRRGVDPLGAALGDLRPCEWQNSAAAKTHRKKHNLCVRDGCVGRAAAGCLSETGSHFAFDAKKEFRVQFGWLPIRLKNTLSSMAKARRQPAVKKPAAKADETRAALRC